jgi:hypothetical protein
MCIMPGPVLIAADLPSEEKQEAINATLVKLEGSPCPARQRICDPSVPAGRCVGKLAADCHAKIPARCRLSPFRRAPIAEEDFSGR